LEAHFRTRGPIEVGASGAPVEEVVACRALFVLGAGRREIAEVVSAAPRTVIEDTGPAVVERIFPHQRVVTHDGTDRLALAEVAGTGGRHVSRQTAVIVGGRREVRIDIVVFGGDPLGK